MIPTGPRGMQGPSVSLFMQRNRDLYGGHRSLEQAQRFAVRT
jgi:hypothetical protein